MPEKITVELLKNRGLSKKYFETLLSKKLTLKEISIECKLSVWTIMKYFKVLDIKPLGSSFFNRGINNPAKRDEVRKKISTTVKGLWDNDVYKDRINGMTFKYDWEHPSYKGGKYTYRDYVKMYHEELKCSICSSSERKIDIHHLDGDHNNWLLTNLVPVCNVCHQFFHFKRYKTPNIVVGKTFYFEASHRLLNYIGKCENQHGHSYFLEVYLKGPILRHTGMVMDFGELSNIVKTYILEDLDHNDLTFKLDCNSTAENMVQYIWERLEKVALLKGLYKIILKETNTSVVILDKDSMLEYYTLNKELIIRKHPKQKNYKRI